jgi:hypothetical protein
LTSVIGSNVITCPACDRRYRLPRFGSVFLGGWVRWSDGREAGDLYKPADPVSRCACGALFLRAQPVIEYIPWTYVPSRPKPGLVRRALNRLTGKSLPAPPERPPLPEPIPSMEAGEMFALAHDFPPDLDDELASPLRRQVWRSLNDPARKLGAPTLAPDRDRARSANLEGLLPLLLRQEEPDHLEVGEAYRELGRFDEACRWFAKVVGDREGEAERLLERAAAGDRTVCIVWSVDQPDARPRSDRFYEPPPDRRWS